MRDLVAAVSSFFARLIQTFGVHCAAASKAKARLLLHRLDHGIILWVSIISLVASIIVKDIYFRSLIFFSVRHRVLPIILSFALAGFPVNTLACEPGTVISMSNYDDFPGAVVLCRDYARFREYLENGDRRAARTLTYIPMRIDGEITYCPNNTIEDCIEEMRRIHMNERIIHDKRPQH